MSSKAANMFAPCPGSPNCVYSLAENKKNFVEPIPYHGEKAVAQYELLEILHSLEFKKLIQPARFFCQNCGRGAVRSENLCNPEDLN